MAYILLICFLKVAEKFVILPLIQNYRSIIAPHLISDNDVDTEPFEAHGGAVLEEAEVRLAMGLWRTKGFLSFDAFAEKSCLLFS